MPSIPFPCVLQLCELLCINGRHTDITAAIHYILLNHGASLNCSSTISLTIGYSVLFANGLVPSHWIDLPLSAQRFSVDHLKWDLLRVQHISDYAFSHCAFRSTRTLTLLNAGPSLILEPLAFAGLTALDMLHLLSVEKRHVPDFLRVMDPAIALRAIRITGHLKDGDPYQLAELTGNPMGSSLRSLRVHANLRRAIRADTFRGLTGLLVLHLDDCDIEQLAADALHAMRSTLQVLTLLRNSLRTLPTGLLASILPRSDFHLVLLAENPWQCDCQLRDLQNAMRLYPARFGDYSVCGGPAREIGLPVRWAAFCGSRGAEAFYMVVCGVGSRNQLVGIVQRMADYRIVIDKLGRNASLRFGNDSTFPAGLILDVKRWGHILRSSYLSNASLLLDDLMIGLDAIPHAICVRRLNSFSPLDCVVMLAGRHFRDKDRMERGMQLFVLIVFIAIMLLSFIAGIYLGLYILQNIIVYSPLQFTIRLWYRNSN